MSSNFFIRKSKQNSKRKSFDSKNSVSKKNKVNAQDKSNGKEIDSDEISSDEEDLKRNSDVESDENLVSAQEKKVLLAKKYLEEIEREEKERLETGDVRRGVTNRLREDLLDQAGKLTKKVADKLLKPEDSDIFVLRCKEHKLSITCIATSYDSTHIFSASKDANIVKWDLSERRKVGVILSKHLEKDENRD
ncbi:U3 small nucleolar RNA-interacting protein 2 isoform X2 [Macrosteles quadrilineatus]|uniref:U3 small nucleolar RNA-interacting protein 2 isoform X2 n=1 Tax=Macrosteles quadrilineatus TaxID=74068 RepID=UPI0023E2FED9|nr:U3 small nucleolar RNA-interacting protein 2 isoform X2 [Macrosteles quadrilineatus]